MGNTIKNQIKKLLIRICRFFIRSLNRLIKKMEHNNPISLKSCVSRRKRRITVLNNSILQNWKSLWISSANNSSIIDFQEVVEANYKLFQAEAKYNQSKNFKEKGKIVLQVKIGSLVIGLLSIYIFAFKRDIDFTSFLPFLVAICVLLAAFLYASVKAIEVKKYQETWARHQNSFFLMQSEMVKYCNHLSPYDKPGDDTNKMFMERIMSVLEINNSKFVANMENKEMQLSDLPSKIVLKS